MINNWQHKSLCKKRLTDGQQMNNRQQDGKHSLNKYMELIFSVETCKEKKRNQLLTQQNK